MLVKWPTIASSSIKLNLSSAASADGIVGVCRGCTIRDYKDEHNFGLLRWTSRERKKGAAFSPTPDGPRLPLLHRTLPVRSLTRFFSLIAKIYIFVRSAEFIGTLLLSMSRSLYYYGAPTGSPFPGLPGFLLVNYSMNMLISVVLPSYVVQACRPIGGLRRGVSLCCSQAAQFSRNYLIFDEILIGA